jgi:hypothetical protein
MKKSNVDIGSMAIAGAIVFAVYKLSGLFKKQEASSNLNVPGGGSLTQLDADLIGQRLYNAMSGVGTDESTLFAELENRTAAQLVDIYNAYGTPYYFLYGGDPYFGAPTDLFGWFNNELSGNDLSRMKQIFAKTNLTWT